MIMRCGSFLCAESPIDPYSLLQNTHFLPPLPEITNTDESAGLAFDILRVQKLIFLAKGKEVSKKRIEVRLGSQV